LVIFKEQFRNICKGVKEKGENKITLQCKSGNYSAAIRQIFMIGFSKTKHLFMEKWYDFLLKLYLKCRHKISLPTHAWPIIVTRKDV